MIKHFGWMGLFIMWSFAAIFAFMGVLAGGMEEVAGYARVSNA